jgi:hypothetical protein
VVLLAAWRAANSWWLISVIMGAAVLPAMTAFPKAAA